MSNAKVHKSYRPRFQTPRKRHKLTNYTKRRKMIRPNLKKYTTKSRMVVRFTNQKVICQIIKAYSIGDKVDYSASSDELKHYGLNVGLKNYSAAYATGLLLAKRATSGAPQKAKSNDTDDQRPYTVFLDIGLKRNTKGGRVYAALKGALDGGLYVPHNAERIFHEELEKQIHGKSVIDYMSIMKKENPEKYRSHFSQYLKNNLDETTLESHYRNIFEQIRNKPLIKKEKVKEVNEQ